ncbi:MAG: YtxH domain-containing protein [Clostridium sp.]
MAKAVKTAALSAAIGVTAGAAAGVLLAPKSGKETREDIVNKSVEAKDKLVEKTKATKAAISTKVSEGKKDVSAAKEKIAEYLASKKGEVLELGNTVEELSDANVETEVKIEEEITAEV